jgi:hypothetical protein
VVIEGGTAGKVNRTAASGGDAAGRPWSRLQLRRAAGGGESLAPAKIATMAPADAPAAPQHRFYVGPIKVGLSPAEASGYWHREHVKIVPDLPRLTGYVQNRPLPPWRDAIPLLACAETWYASREDERFSYESDFYSETIVPDEERFIDRSTSWTSAVAATELRNDAPRGAFRLIAIGGDPDALDLRPEERVEVLRLRQAPSPTEETVLSVWTGDRGRADLLAPAAGGLSFVSESVAVVAPPWR